MTKAIQVLEQMANDASLQNPQATEQLLIDNNIEESIAAAIINKDVISLERQLDVRPDIVCFVAPAEDDDEEKDDDNGDTDSSEETSNHVIGF